MGRSAYFFLALVMKCWYADGLFAFWVQIFPAVIKLESQSNKFEEVVGAVIQWADTWDSSGKWL